MVLQTLDLSIDTRSFQDKVVHYACINLNSSASTFLARGKVKSSFRNFWLFLFFFYKIKWIKEMARERLQSSVGPSERSHSLHKSCTVCLPALQQCIHESPRGSHISDSSPRDSVVCSKQEKLANLWRLFRSIQLKNLLRRTFCHRCEPSRIYRCSLCFICLTVSHYFGDLHARWVENIWNLQTHCPGST